MGKRATITSSHLDTMKARKPDAETPKSHATMSAGAVVTEPKASDTRRAQTLRMNDAAWRQLKIMAMDERKTMHDMITEGINLVFEKYGQPPVA